MRYYKTNPVRMTTYLFHFFQDLPVLTQSGFLGLSFCLACMKKVGSAFVLRTLWVCYGD